MKLDVYLKDEYEPFWYVAVPGDAVPNADETEPPWEIQVKPDPEALRRIVTGADIAHPVNKKGQPKDAVSKNAYVLRQLVKTGIVQRFRGLSDKGKPHCAIRTETGELIDADLPKAVFLLTRFPEVSNELLDIVMGGFKFRTEFLEANSGYVSDDVIEEERGNLKAVPSGGSSKRLKKASST